MQAFIKILFLMLPLAAAAGPTYEELSAAQSGAARMDAREIAAAKLEGVCLAAIKQLNSYPKEEFHPNIEWLRIRSSALLSHVRPCEVLLMLESAHDVLDTENAPKNRND
ncbi:MAG: hypothetical protein MJA83_13655 [Gammaproteobacteria bacterium]|nr:hypothetical protein [Gammaproteobacteria bacterium]